jgi:8-oxo-dGTP pyrophosphatase MutT (NUDIX family)
VKERTLTLDQFSTVAPRLLRADPPITWDRSDDDMNLNARMIPAGVVPKAASVLIGVHDGPSGPRVLLTERKASLSKHAGQIAFPGGRMDEGETPLQTALREAQEETGLDPAQVEPLGYLDGYLIITGYFVVPVVARIHDVGVLVAHEHEVESIFDVPLDFVLNAANRKIHSRDWNGLTRSFYAYPFGERYIWGATAGMFKNLADRFQNAEA